MAQAATIPCEVILASNAVSVNTGERVVDPYAHLSTQSGNPDLFRAIRKASEYYQIHLLTKQLNGHAKTLVVMAAHDETIESSDSQKNTQNLIHYFNAVGVTGQSRSTWGTKLSQTVFQPIREKLGIKPLPKRFWLARLIARLYGQLDQANSTSIVDLQNAPQPASSTQPQVINLAQNRMPGFFENIDSIGSYITWGLCAIFYGISAHMPHAYILSVDWALTAASTYRYSSRWMVTSPNFKMNAWYRRFFPLGVGVMNGKNSTIAANIQRALESETTDNPTVDNMLVIVPKNHIDGLLTLLENQGYE